MKTILKSRFFEFNLILFPVWILFVYFFINSLIVSKELTFFLFLFLFGETHFASTFLFYLNSKNFNYIKSKFYALIAIPIIIVLIYIIIGIVDFETAIILGAIGSGIHVTRQSIGIQRLYGFTRNIFFENITYIASFGFIFVGFCRFYLENIIERLNIKLELFFLDNYNLNQFFIILVIILSIISFTEKTNLKKRLVNLTGVLIYSPYLFVTNVYDAIIIGVGAHWCQYLAINYKVYFYNEKFTKNKIFIILFIFSYAFIMSSLGYKYQFDKVLNLLILIPLSGQFFHYYVDAFIWRFSDNHIREIVGKKLFS